MSEPSAAGSAQTPPVTRTPPTLEKKAGAEEGRLAQEALLDDQARRWERGERLLVETYLAQQPALSQEPEAVLDLLYHEVVLREAHGEPVDMEEYVRRFPQWAAQLRLHFQVHRAIDPTAQNAVSAGLITYVGPSEMSSPASLGRDAGWPIVPGYDIEAELGRGGMGVVYKARHRALNRVVALKMFSSARHGGPREMSRFRSEAEVVAQLQHPHIVQIYEVGELDGQPFFSMEFISGGSLERLAAGTPQPAREAAQLVETLARTIHHAHGHGIIHRDLKPANILLAGVRGQGSGVRGQTSGVGSRGAGIEIDRAHSTTSLTPDPCPLTPKITDFGLAKLLDAGEAGPTKTGDLLGTPSYMAPEQIEAKTGAIGPAADVYGLGSILYELLTGRPPFNAETAMETLLQVKLMEPVSPSRFQPKLPRDLVTICLRCLHKEPRKRYASALALADDFRRFLDGEPVQARPVSRGEKLWRWCRRKPLVAVLLASVVLLALFVVVGTPLAAFWWREQRDESRRNETRAESALWESYLKRAELGRLGKQFGQRFDGLDLLSKASRIRGSPDIRNAAIACLALTDLKVSRQWPLRSSASEGAAFDAPLKRYAYQVDRNRISVRSTDDRKLALLPGPDPAAWVFEMKFSPDGRYLAAVYKFKFPEDQPSRALVWDLSQAAKIFEKSTDPAGFGLDFSADSNRIADLSQAAKIFEKSTDPAGFGLDFSPDSSRIALSLGDGLVGIFAIAGGQELSRCEKSCHPHTLAFNPSGRRLAVSSIQDHLVEIRDLDNGGRVSAKFAHPSGVNQSAWSGDGKLLATACHDKNAYVWDVSANRQLAALTGHKDPVVTVAFNHVGDLLASASWDFTTKLWDPVAGVNLLTAHGHCYHFDSDGEQLAYIDSPQLGIWELAGRNEFRTLHFGRVGRSAPEVDNGGPWSVDFSSDGRLLAAAGEDGVRLWDMPAAREVAHLPVEHSESALFSRGETILITYGRQGLKRWPIQRNPPKAGDAGLGPAVLLRTPTKSGPYRAALSQDGTKIAYLDPTSQQAIVINSKGPGEPVKLEGLPRAVNVALSPTGRWAAVGDWRSKEAARVWDLTTSTTKPVWQLPESGSCGVAFSPNGHWFVTSEQDKYRFWQVGSWTPGLAIGRDRLEPGPGPVAFSPDSRVLAIARSASTVQLIESATGREIATLSAPDPQIINSLCFSPDGGQLAVATNNHTIQLWDLRLIQRKLDESNFDGELPIGK
jgi:serine/threonine protein kinase/WD40 repeat protein